MRRAVGGVAVLIALQALLGGIWWWVERGRRSEEPAVSARAWVTHLNTPAPRLTFERPNGSEGDLSALRGDPFILHLWATWCPPCRDELPALLAYAERGEVAVLAVSVDGEWGAVEGMLGSDLPPYVARASAQGVEEAFGITALPATLLVDGEGRIRARADGPLDWGSGEDVARLMEGLSRP